MVSYILPLIVGTQHLPKLTVKGASLVDPKGKAVTLRGANLGNWHVIEFWMLGLSGEPGAPGDQYRLEELLTKRFGELEKDRLMEIYRANWIQERDFAELKKFNFNFVRLPMNYRMMEDDRHPFQLKPNVEDQKRLSWLWGNLAKRYRNRTAVMGYDTFNEPYGMPKPTQVSVFKQVYAEIRKNDPEKLVLAHGNYDDFDHYGDPYLGVTILGAAMQIRDDLEGALDVYETNYLEATIKAGRQILSNEKFDEAIEQGRAMSVDNAVELALEDHNV